MVSILNKIPTKPYQSGLVRDGMRTVSICMDDEKREVETVNAVLVYRK